MQFKNFEGTDLNYENSILKFQPKNTQIRHFWSQIYGFLFLHQTFQLEKFGGVDFKFDKSFFLNPIQKIPK